MEVSWNNIPEFDHHHCCYQGIIQSLDIKLVLIWNVKVLQNFLKLTIALTVDLFSIRISTLWSLTCYEVWRLVTQMSWNNTVTSSLCCIVYYLLCMMCHIWNVPDMTLSAFHKPWCLSFFMIYSHMEDYSFFLKIEIHSMQGWTATTRHKVTRKRSKKRLQHTGNLFRKNGKLKDVC